jgi:phosphoglycolate phosphatase-like HAD superfamily hydrolase
MRWKMSKTECWIFDVDGTLSNTAHRQHYLATTPKNWAAWNAAMAEDSYHKDVIQFVRVAKKLDMCVVICTGREETEREVTENWLDDGGIDYDGLYMRKKKDYRGDDDIKRELLAEIRADGYEPVLVFDDRNRVVDMWRAEGIRCFQVAPGNF